MQPDAQVLKQLDICMCLYLQCAQECAERDCDTIALRYGKFCGVGHGGCPGEDSRVVYAVKINVYHASGCAMHWCTQLAAQRCL
jgi:hypothetical protein